MYTGATDHITNNLDKMTSKEKYNGKDMVQTTNGSVHKEDPSSRQMWGWTLSYQVAAHHFYLHQEQLSASNQLQSNGIADLDILPTLSFKMSLDQIIYLAY